MLPVGEVSSGSSPLPVWFPRVTTATSGSTFEPGVMVVSSELVRPSVPDGFAAENNLEGHLSLWSPPELELLWDSGVALSPTGGPGLGLKLLVGSFFMAPTGDFFKGPDSARLQAGPALVPFIRNSPSPPGLLVRTGRSPGLVFNLFWTFPKGLVLAIVVDEEFCLDAVGTTTGDAGFEGRSPAPCAEVGATCRATEPLGTVSPTHLDEMSICG